jgi:hypothetical protein
MATDTFSSYGEWLDSPAKNAATVTPNDGADLPNASRALYIGSTGNIKVDMVGGQTVTFSGLPTGMMLPIRVTRVYSTGTTASSIIALY